MTVTRRGGISGKECTSCGEWKMLGEFPTQKVKNRLMELPYCKICYNLAKAEEKRKLQQKGHAKQ